MGVTSGWPGAAIAVLAAAAAAAPAAARPAPRGPQLQTNVTLTGALTIAWTADPARGCQAAGLCGVSGSIEVLPSGSESSSGSMGSAPPSPFPLDVSDFNSAARVIDRASDGTVVSACADPVPVDLGLTVRHTATGLRAVANGPGFQAPSSGGCAGPTAGDLQALSLPARRVGAHSYDLSGQTTFGAGPLTITATSTIHAHVTIGPVNGGPGFPPPPIGFFGHPPTPRRALEETARVAYRVVAMHGSFEQSFAGVAAPLCAVLGACGTSGALTDTLGALRAMNFTAARIVARPVGRDRALADVRSGAMRLEPFPAAAPVAVTVAETLSEAGGGTCSDSARFGQVSPVPAAGHRLIQLRLQSSTGPGASADLLRTRCPGPSSADALPDQGGVLATALVRPSQIGASRLTLTFAADGAFTGNGYAGRRSGALVVTLARIRASGGTRTLETFRGAPLP